MAAVAPLDSPPPKRVSVSSTSAPAGPVTVCISFPGDPNYRAKSSWDTLAADSTAREDVIGDVQIRQYAIIGRVFVSHDTGEIVHDLEKAFCLRRYSHIRAAFRIVSALMALGALVPAIDAVLDSKWLRFALLAGFISPVYVVYAMLTCTKGFEQISGTRLEKLIVALLTLQYIAIHASEWARSKPDYGFTVMHFSFIHNFTPLGGTVVHTISIIVGLFPYMALRMVRHLYPDSTIDDDDVQETFRSTKKYCIKTSGFADVLIGMLVPFILLIFQTLVTIMRSRAMRLNMLDEEQLKMQQTQLDRERKTTEDTLRSMLPRQVIVSLKNNEPVNAQFFENVTVIFAEICCFDDLCAEMAPELVVEVLNVIYLEFDRLSDLLHVYKVETVGQVYMAVVGCPEHIKNHADVATHFGLACLESLNCLRDEIKEIQFKAAKTDEADARVIQARVGLNSGRLRAGVVGLESPRYKLVGDTVNTASRMESTCLPGRVQVSPSTLEQLTPDLFSIEDRGEINVKGKDKMRTAFVNGYADATSAHNPEVTIETDDALPRAECSEPMLGPDSPKRSPSFSRIGTRALRLGSFASVSRIKTSGLFDDAETSRHPHSALSTRSTLSRALTIPEVTDDMATSSIRPTFSVRNQRASALTGALPALSAALKRNFLTDEAEESGMSFAGRSSLRMYRSGAFHLNHLFLFVSSEYKNNDFLRRLKFIVPLFQEATLQSRIAFSRNLTLLWLLALSVVTSVDYTLDVVTDDVERYRTALIFRMTVNYIVVILYLLCLSSPDLFRMSQQCLSVIMLSAQGVALLVSALLIYNNEPFVVVLFGVYVSEFSACTIPERLCICLAAVLGFMLLELIRCDFTSAKSESMSLLFLICFFCFISCGIHLEEFMAHVHFYEKRCLAAQSEEIKIMKASGNELLMSLLPPHVVSLVRKGVSPIAEPHENVTIIFTDIKGFTAFSSGLTPAQLMTFLNSMFSAWDEVILNWGLYKVEVIGDAYCISSGCPAASPAWKRDEAAMRAVEVALVMLRTMSQVCNDSRVQMRVGLHTGPVVAGVVGKKGPRFHLFGPTVNYAEKMESHGEPSRVHISDAVKDILQEGQHEYELEERSISVDGMDSKQRTWFVNKSNCKAASKLQRGLLMKRREENQRGALRLTAQEESTNNRTNSKQSSEGSDAMPGSGPKLPMIQ